jgi:hypothetical protein
VNAFVDRDRGLGSAYERYCFYQRLEAWAKTYDVHSMLEGPLDGMAGVAGVHGVGLAMQGVQVTVAVDTEAKADLARGVYASVAAPVDVRVTSKLEDLAPADLVLAYHSLPLVAGWRGYVKELAAHAKKLLVVTVCNPDNWGVAAIRAAARLRGIGGMETPETWRTDVLAPALWEVGRVVDHVYFDCPWWPDLQVSAGQSLADRTRQLFRQKKSDVQFTADPEGVQLAESFVYGPAKWPYFGGPGWREELLPALLRHPGFDGSKTRFLSRLAHLHAFVVDMRPRTPQARRRLGQVQ